MNNNNGRSINILLCMAGVLCCIGSGLVSAPKGLLADESVNLLQAMTLSHMLLFYALPSALMVLACIFVMIGRMDILSLCSVLAGGILFAVMDFQLGVRHQAYTGVLISMIGVILVAAGVALQVFATETGPVKVSRKAAKNRDPKEFRYERRHRPAYDDIYLDTTGLAHAAQLSRGSTQDSELSEEERHLALEMTAAEEADAEVAQEQQEAEIEAMLRAFSMETESDEPADEFITEISDTVTEPVKAVEKNSKADAEIEEILAEMQANAGTESDDEGNKVENVAMANMAAALETPNQTMTDFYAGIEDIFLDSDNQ